MNEQFRWGAEREDGCILMGPVYGDFDVCYDAYIAAMKELEAKGADLRSYKWRGVFSLAQMGLIVTGNSIYFDKLTVQKDAW